MRWLWRRLGNRGFALWLALAVMLLLEHVAVAGSGGENAPAWWHSAIGAAGFGVAVAARRTRPLVTLVVAVGLAVVQLLLNFSTGGPYLVSYVVVLTLASWLAGRHSDRARGFATVVVAGNLLLLPVGVPLLADRTVAEAILEWFFAVLWSLIFVVVPWLLGRYRRQQFLLASAGWERAERTEREQQMAVDQARLRERTRIAQDMHDSLGHELSLIALRAGALEVAPDLDDRHRTAASELRSSAATATERLGEIIGVLREQDAHAPLHPTGESIEELVERASGSGLEVRLVSEGAAPTHLPMVQQAAHRVVQEALTNVSKHAPGAPVSVRVRHIGDDTRVRVVNGRPARAPIPSPGSGGHGLPGLQERVRLLGGELRSGPTGDGGFEVAARLPHAEAGFAPPADQSAASEAAAALATARTRARRGLVTAVATPLALGAGLGVLMLGYYLAIGYSSVLDPPDYEALRVGQSRTEVESVLPPLQMLDEPSDDDVPSPPGSTCEFYRPDGPFSITFAYRLCFADGRLASKDVIQSGEVPVDEEGSR